MWFIIRLMIAMSSLSAFSAPVGAAGMGVPPSRPTPPGGAGMTPGMTTAPNTLGPAATPNEQAQGAGTLQRGRLLDITI